MQNMLIFYSLLLIQIYWITFYVGSLTGGSDQSSNGPVTSCAHKKFLLEILQHGDMSAQLFIYWGTTVATCISDVSRVVATEKNHSSDRWLPSSSRC
jgi:hypothetical protein